MKRVLLYRDVFNAGHGMMGSAMALGDEFEGQPSTWPEKIALAFPDDTDNPMMPVDVYGDVILRRRTPNDKDGTCWYVDAGNEQQLLIITGALPD